jgi:hypothetical protein
MMMTPQTMYFFRDELEKQAIFTPASASWAMKYAKPGMFGNAVRKAGQLGFKAQQFAVDATPAVTNIANSAYLGPGVAMGTLKGELAKAALRRVPTPSAVPTGVAKRAKSALTWESRNSPLETSYNPADLSNFIPTPSF